jgi:hypothetical protein
MNLGENVSVDLDERRWDKTAGRRSRQQRRYRRMRLGQEEYAVLHEGWRGNQNLGGGEVLGKRRRCRGAWRGRRRTGGEQGNREENG